MEKKTGRPPITGVKTLAQHGTTVYLFTLTGAQIVELGLVERFGEDEHGVNRRLNEEHALAIAEAMQDPRVLWPDPLVTDLRGPWIFDPKRGQFIIDGDSSFCIDDGQHRFTGLTMIDPAERERITFVIYATQGLTLEERLRLFRAQIERRKIDPRLDKAQRHVLQDWRRPIDGETYDLAKRLNEDPQSPLHEWVILDERSQRVVDGAPRYRLDGINGNGLSRAIRGLINSHAPLHQFDQDTRYTIIRDLLCAAKDTWPTAWASNLHMLRTAHGIYALFLLLKKGAGFRGLIGEHFSREAFCEALKRAPRFDWKATTWRNTIPETIAERLNAAIERNTQKKDPG